MKFNAERAKDIAHKIVVWKKNEAKRKAIKVMRIREQNTRTNYDVDLFHNFLGIFT